VQRALVTHDSQRNTENVSSRFLAPILENHDPERIKTPPEVQQFYQAF